MNAILAWPRMMNPDEAEAYCGGKLILDDLVKKQLLKPREQRKGFTRYDRCEIDAALDQWKGLGA